MSSQDSVEVINLTHVRVRIVQDEDAQNPREDRDHLGRMVCWHRNYTLGDDHNFGEPDDFVTDMIGDDVSDRIERWYDKQYMKIAAPYGTPEWHEVMTALRKTYYAKRWAAVEKIAIVVPLYLYDHSGITIRTAPFSCPWDSGQCGYTYITKADARKEYGPYLTKKRLELVAKMLDSEVEEFDDYLTGRVYGFIVETMPSPDADGEIDEDEEGEHLDSCWGFYGLDYCREEALSAARAEEKPLAESAALIAAIAGVASEGADATV